MPRRRRPVPPPPRPAPARPFGRARERVSAAAPAARRRWRPKLRPALGALSAVFIVLVAGFGLAIHQTWLADLPPMPSREGLWSANRAPAIRFLDRTGRVIAARGPRYGERVRLEDLPEHVPLAFLAAEEHRPHAGEQAP